MNIVAFIFARGGSKGLPGKNIKPLMGKPLIAYPIEIAQACPSINRVVVSTDDPHIADIARQYGAEIPFMRPAELAQDSSPEWLAWQHALQHVSPVDIFVSLPTTAPLRAVEDVEKSIALLLNSQADFVFTVREPASNPYYSMVKLDAEGYASVVIPPDNQIHGRQAAPPVYDVTPVAYVTRPEFIMTHNGIFEGKVKTVLVPRERAIDIDTAFDFQLAEFFLSHR